ncbi:MAG TPA: PorV/PorQ family protein [Longimicrobiales bacterium]
MFYRLRRMTSPGLLAATFGLPASALAQDGIGTTGAPVLQFLAGSRAAAFSGAYTAAIADADALFYNPAGAAGLDGAVSLSYQRHVEDIAFGSIAGVLAVGPVALGLGAAYFDAGEVPVTVPDPAYGGERGRETGETAAARESAVRLAAALPLGRFHIGAAAGFVSSDLAGITRSAPIFDLGAQFVLDRVTLGASLRNLGGDMTGADAQDTPLPTELRAGAMLELAGTRGLGVRLAADVISDIRAGTATVAGGVEAGILPGATRRLSAVARVGLDTEGQGDGGLGAIRVGGGIALDDFAVDYTYQQLDFFGAIHRFGIRWSRAPR